MAAVIIMVKYEDVPPRDMSSCKEQHAGLRLHWGQS